MRKNVAYFLRIAVRGCFQNGGQIVLRVVVRVVNSWLLNFCNFDRYAFFTLDVQNHEI